MSIEERLIRTRFVVDAGHPHITVDVTLCAGCPDAACVRVCPAGCYSKEGETITCSWESCLECGSCRVVCPAGAITWRYPRGGFGVCYRYG